MRADETFRRVQRVHGRCAKHHVSSESGDLAARSGIQKESRREPAQAWAETEGQTAFRFPLGKRPTNLVDRRFFSHLAGKFGIGETLTCDLRNRKSEPLAVGQYVAVVVLPVVVAESLFIKIPEQVERFHADVRAIEPALQEAPKVFNRVRVYVAVHVLYGVIHDAVRVVQSPDLRTREGSQCRPSCPLPRAF